MLDETEKLLAAAAQQATTPAATDTVAQGSIAEGVQKFDSINHTIIDTVRNMGIGDIKAVVTGENTIFKDALSGLLDLTVAFIPKLLGCILVLWIGFKLIKLLKKALTKLLDKRNAESTLKGFLTSLVDVLG